MKRVVITGLGAITPLGKNVTENWEGAIAGKCGIDTLKGFEEEEMSVSVAGQVKDFDPIAAGLDRKDVRHYDLYCQYALVAAIEAMSQSGLESGVNVDPDRLGVYIGSGIGGLLTLINQTKEYFEGGSRRVSPLLIPMMIGNMASGNTAIHFNAQGVNISNVAACATSTNSVGEAFLAIRNGLADAIITGGAEAAIHPLAIGGFANSRALSTESDPSLACVPFDARRKGFVMGEGAGILVLEELEHAKARGAHIIAEVCGYGNTCDAHHYTAPRPDGTTTARAISQALSMAQYKEGENLYINAHGTGTPLNDKAETKAICIALGEKEANRANISSTKSMTGHMLGAAGAVELIFSALAIENGIIPPTIGYKEADPECFLNYTPNEAVKRDLDIAVSNSLGFGGHNASVALRKYKE